MGYKTSATFGLIGSILCILCLFITVGNFFNLFGITYYYATQIIFIVAWIFFGLYFFSLLSENKIYSTKKDAKHASICAFIGVSGILLYNVINIVYSVYWCEYYLNSYHIFDYDEFESTRIWRVVMSAMSICYLFIYFISWSLIAYFFNVQRSKKDVLSFFLSVVKEYG